MLLRTLLLAFLFTAFNAFAPSYAASTPWNKYLGVYPCAGKDRFFREPEVLHALKPILGKDWSAFEQHRSMSGCSAIARYNNYLFVDISQLHVGGYESMVLFNPENKTAYVFWLKGRVLDWDAVTYGKHPIPGDVLDKFQHELSLGWGHVASFDVQNGSLAIIKRPSSPIIP